MLGWQPRFDDLDAIVGDALAWERELMARRMLSAGATQLIQTS
jgi:hypothetical protein